jgi:hypothetical protein
LKVAKVKNPVAPRASTNIGVMIYSENNINIYNSTSRIYLHYEKYPVYLDTVSNANSFTGTNNIYFEASRYVGYSTTPS